MSKDQVHEMDHKASLSQDIVIFSPEHDKWRSVKHEYIAKIHRDKIWNIPLGFRRWGQR